MPRTIKRVALIILFIALAIGGVGLLRILKQSNPPDMRNAVGADASRNAEIARTGAQPAPATPASTQTQNAAAPDKMPNAPVVIAPAGTSGRYRQLKPFVALAITQSSGSVEELCPELAQEAKGSPPSASAEERKEDAQGCVLPIGGEEAASVQQASMPLESGRPPAPFPRKGMNNLPLVGGLGAAVAGIPVIAGLSENKDSSSQPISPD